MQIHAGLIPHEDKKPFKFGSGKIYYAKFTAKDCTFNPVIIVKKLLIIDLKYMRIEISAV